MVDGIGSAFIGEQKSSAQASSKLFDNNAETYLNLFLTQLKNQDPTKPFDTAQMTEQLAQLNSSQQLIDVNSNLETLIAANTNSQAASITNLINKDVKYLSNQVYSTGANTNEISYILDKNYVSTSIEIKDELGNIVNKTEGETGQGPHSIFWDGKDANGNPVAEGVYYISVFGENTDGTLEESRTMVTGTVSGVDFTGSEGPVVTVGYGNARTNINLENIAAVNDFSNVPNNSN